MVGNRIRLTRRSTDTPANGSRKWESWIDAAEKKGDAIVARVAVSHGRPRMMLRLTGSEAVEYEILEQPLETPNTLREIAALESYVEAQEEDAVGGVIGTADYVETTHLMSRGLDESFRRIPDDPERIEWLWTQYERIRGPERLRQLVDADYARSLVTVFIKNANFVDTGNLMRDIRAYEQEHLSPHGIRIEFAGDVAVSQTLIDSIVSTQTGSLLWSLLGSLAIITLLTRSLARGLLCLVPCGLAVTINFGVMGFAGMPLGVATSMFSAMAIGIGDDFAIHLVERYRAACAQGATAMEAIVDAVQVTGPAIIVDALAVGAGFGVLILSQVPANARLGGMLVLSMASSLAATLFLLPAMISFTDRGASRVVYDF
jgi:predicted RND superfamily exporter protein